MLISGLVVGVVFGFLVQRGQFCFTSGFRDIYWQRDFSFLFALFIAITIQSIGLFTLSALGLLRLPTTPLPLLATLIGGLIFGVGMAIARVCATGGWFRSGEGVIGASVTLFVFTLTLTSAQSGSLKPILSPLLKSPLESSNIYLTLGVSPWWLVGAMILATLGLFFVCRKHPHKSRLYFTATALGVLGVVAWVASAWSGRNYGFGISVPTMHLFQYLTTGQQRYLNWGTLFVLGIFIGSFISAKAYKEFEWRALNGVDFLRSVCGGVLMGVGAYLARGCTATNALVATAYFSWQGWIAMLMMIVGCVIGSSFFRVKHCELRRK